MLFNALVGSTRWAAEITVEEVRERNFVLDGSASRVPGVLWLPMHEQPAPALVMLGHGGSGHKRSQRVLRLARWLAAEVGLAAVAIDGPYHGDRAPAPSTSYQNEIASEDAHAVVDRMVDEWIAALSAVALTNRVDAERLGYFGLSMGTRYGLPLAARLGDRLQCAAFGKFGLVQTAALPPGLDTSDRIRADAPRVSATCLFHVQWDDELFTRDGQLALFDLIGSHDKRLIAYPGSHAASHPDSERTYQSFLLQSLVSAG